MHSADSLRQADYIKAGNALETGKMHKRDALIVLRILPLLAAIPQYTLNNTQNTERFNTVVQNAFNVLPTETDLNQTFILPTRQESEQTLNHLKNTNLKPSEFIESLQAVSGK